MKENQPKFDATNLHTRLVITPDGEGELIGLDDKENPHHGVVLVRIDGYKHRCGRCYAIEKLEEVVK